MTISTAPSNSYLLLSALYSTGTMNITCSLHSVQYNNSNLPVLVLVLYHHTVQTISDEKKQKTCPPPPNTHNFSKYSNQNGKAPLFFHHSSATSKNSHSYCNSLENHALFHRHQRKQPR